MTTTDIRFSSKQQFSAIKSVIEKEFGCIVRDEPSHFGLIHFAFEFKGHLFWATFCQDNQIHQNGGEIIYCSTLFSDRPNEIKTEAFLKIAEHFDCTFWENDCNEDNFRVFSPKKRKTPNRSLGYKSTTQTEKNIAWFLPRPKKDRYKGGMPLYCEEWLIELTKDILGQKNIDLLNVFCGMNKHGFRVDMKAEVNPDLLCDIHKLSECLSPKEYDLIIADPPYSTLEAKEIYETPALKYKVWTSECDKYLKVGGLFMVYHKYVMPNPNPEKYEVVKRVFIGNRTMHLPRVCIVFRKKS